MMRMGGVLLPVVLVLATGGPVSAAGPQEDLVRRWLETASFGLPVSIGGSRFNPATQAVELTDVTIGGKDGGFVTVTFPDMTVEDPRLTATGAFAAHAVRASRMEASVRVDPAQWFPEFAKAADAPPDGAADGSGAAVTTEVTPAFDMAITSDTLLVERLVSPLVAPTIPAGAGPFETWLSYARHGLQTRADWAELNTLTFETSGVPEGDSRTSYGLYFIAGMHDGRIERAGFNGMEQTQTIDGDTLTTVVESSYAIGIDGNAILAVVDPSAYAGGTGDGVWRQAILQQGYNSLEVTFPGGSVALGNVELNGFRLRQTAKPPFEMLTRLLAEPDIIERDPMPFLRDTLPALFGFYGVDFVQANDFVVSIADEVPAPAEDGTVPDGEAADPDAAPGVSVTIGQFDLNDVDSDGIGSLALRSVAVEAGEAGSGSLNLFALNDLRFGSFSAFLDLVAASEGGGEPDPKLIVDAVLDGSPTLSFFELGGLAVEMPEGTVGLDAFAVTQGDFFKSIPRRYDLTFTKFSLPASLITDPAAKEQLGKLGYETIEASGGFAFSWDTAGGEVRVDDATLKIADMGTLSADVRLGNLPIDILYAMEAAEERMREGTLVDARLVFGNQSIVERTFEMQAKELNQPPETFRKNFADALPLMLGFLNDRQIQDTFQDVLRTFFTTPQSLVVTLKPAAPLPFTVLDTIQAEAPGEVLKLLGFDITANQ